MSNINIGETDNSVFADQQFISISYNGKLNATGGVTPPLLNYRVTFIANNKIYYIIDVGENQKISAPPIAPIKEGYTFKNWLLNDEAFDFSTTITGNTLLIAEFKEAPVEDVVWEDTLEFVSAEEEMPGWLMFKGEEAFPELDKLNTTDTFTFTIPELNKSVTGKFTSGGENVYILGEQDDGINLQANPSFYTVVVEGNVEGTYAVKLTKSEAPSGYT